MYPLIVGIIIFISVLLILVVLVQNSKGGGLSSQFGGSSSNQFMGVQKTNDLLEKVTWTLAISIVTLTLISNLFISKSDINIDGMSPNIDRANEQNVIQSTPNPNEIGELPQELDSIL
ncbi:MAG: preprotein translocase subunit SecG [Cytophagales bacterium]|nr:preprotein translocase subunit SecG [Cytophagales bacterium]PDH40160.1 MAG: preprotein translocase subunit SecG [Rhodothermaeota bacterium MED-G19]|tara:strand:+ start:163 stop:516 length:354 start_codon:yes stop_codon:yes gene_type:complete